MLFNVASKIWVKESLDYNDNKDVFRNKFSER